jgi:hypothetical protein
MNGENRDDGVVTQMTTPSWVHWAFTALLAVALTGCRVVEETAKMPAKAVNAMAPGMRAPKVDPADLQAELQRYADDYTSRTAAAVQDYARVAGTAEARSQALNWKVSAGFAAVSIASGPNPHANLLDFLALASITRLSVEEAWGRPTNGSAFQAWHNASRVMETNAWKLADGLFSADQQQELRDTVARWWESNPEARTSFFARPEEFSSLIRKAGEQSSRPESVFALVGLDPTAGLDPAVREVTRTRLFAERAMFMAQRAPFLLRWQVELLADEFFQRAEARSLLEGVGRVSRAAESASQTAAQLPDRVTAERKAILAALEEQEGKLRELSAEVGRTLAAGEKMSASLNTTLVTFDAVMKRFGVGEPPAGSPDTNAEPFRIQDYGQTAVQLEGAARQLTELLRTLDQTIGSTNLTQLSAQLGPVVQEAQMGGRQVVDYAFWKGILLLVIALMAALVYRFLATRMTATSSRSNPP